MKAKLHRFPGGMHLDGHKAESVTQDIQLASLPAQLYLPLKQHIGDYNKAVVAIGERVLKGQVIAANPALFCAAVHAPCSGTVSSRYGRSDISPAYRAR